ncbi:MAG TPA: PAS domain-containing sensor histidine kinase [Hanamia sp.]|nr:PAS domain-containing sensor histidine kinase [Hanamia sp.]
MPAPKNFDSFNYLGALFKNAEQNVVILMQTDGTIIAINKAFTHNFGYEEKDLIGRNTAMLFTEEDQKKGLPKKELDKVQKQGQSNDNNYLVDKNNKATWVSGESVLVKNENGEAIILKVIQNIHQQKADEIAIRELNNFNENILATINDAVIVLDKNLNVVKVNAAFQKLLGKGMEVSSFNFAQFIKPYDTDDRLYKELQQALALETGFSKVIEIEVQNGDKRIFEVTCTPFFHTNYRDLLLVIRDISMAKELERGREDIIGFITHELRNPLSTLSLLNEIMKEAIQKNDTPLVNNLLIRFENSIGRMNKIIAAFYETTKVSAGHFILELSQFNFGEMVREAVSTIAVLHPSFHIVVIGDENFGVVADRDRLIQVIVNYLSNAIKYSNGNREITLAISNDSDQVTVAVKDKGVGISKEHLPYVFKRFFRIQKTRNIEGIGLGLYLCKQIIRAHKGHVWAESEENKGSSFYFSIPLQPESASSD